MEREELEQVIKGALERLKEKQEEAVQNMENGAARQLRMKPDEW